MMRSRRRSRRGFQLTRREMIGTIGMPAGAALTAALRHDGPTPALASRQQSAGLSKTPIIRTLLGDIAPSVIGAGPILFHEHLSFHPQGTTEHFTDDVEMMVNEARAAKQDGIACIVDASHADGSRSLDALKRISTGAGLPVVASGGYYLQRSYPPEIARKSADTIADELVNEAATSGFGAFGEIGQQFGTLTVDERKVFEAVGKAHVRSALPIFTHNPYNRRLTAPPIPRDAALHQLDVLESAGVNPRRVAIGHMCCLDDPKAEIAIQLARRGAFVGFDRVTISGFMTDAERVVMVMNFVQAGYADQLLLSSDFSSVAALRKNGGPGLAQTATVFGPMLVKAGLPQLTLQRILVDNPRRFVAFVPKT